MNKIGYDKFEQRTYLKYCNGAETFVLNGSNTGGIKTNARTDITDKADSLCLYFHDPTLFDEKKMRKSINFFRFYRDKRGNLIDRYLKHVHCVIKDRDEVLVFDIE